MFMSSLISSVVSSVRKRTNVRKIANDCLSLLVLLTAPVFIASTPITSTSVWAESASEEKKVEESISAAHRLADLLQPLAVLTGEFSQRVTDAQGNITQASSGIFTMSQPGLLRWETVEPFPQLLTINDKYIWIYDPDLEQATRRPVGDSIRNSPALLLSGNSESLEKSYDIFQVNGTDGIQVFHLTPLNADMGITRFTLAFSAGSAALSEFSLPIQITLTDSLGQLTEIELKQVGRKSDADDGLFSFKPPAGIDIVIDGGNSLGSEQTDG